MSRSDSSGKHYYEIPAFSFSARNVLAWQFLAVLALAFCILGGVFQYFGLMYASMALSYILYPISLCMLALLVYTRRYLDYPEIKLLGLFFMWIVLVVILNVWRVDAAFSSTWFYSVCVTTFLCFSIPYAFRFEDVKKILTALAVFLVITVTLLSAVALFYALTDRVGVNSLAPREVFGIGTDLRLRMFCHPNTVAPICGVAIVLIGYLLVKAKRLSLRIVWIICFAVCYPALALTDSRAGILSTALALGFELFLVLNVILSRRRNAFHRVLISILLSIVLMVAFYFGTVLIRSGCSYLIAEQTSVEVEDPDQAVIIVEDATVNTESQPQEDATAPESAPQTVSSRGLTDAITFNARTDIWLSVLKGLDGQWDVLACGTTPLISGDVMEYFFPEGSPVGNFHNSLLAVLIAFGVPGLILVLALLVLLFIACIRLSFRNLKDADSLSLRVVPALILFTLAESMMESFLFTGSMPNIVWIWFMIASGLVFRSHRSDVAAVSASQRSES